MFSFSSAVRGFHVYRDVWRPVIGEQHACVHEGDNPYDIFAIKVCETGGDRAVCHLPMEIYRVTKCLIERGFNVVANVISDYYRRSPLIKGGT